MTDRRQTGIEINIITYYYHYRKWTKKPMWKRRNNCQSDEIISAEEERWQRVWHAGQT